MTDTLRSVMCIVASLLNVALAVLVFLMVALSGTAHGAVSGPDLTVPLALVPIAALGCAGAGLWTGLRRKNWQATLVVELVPTGLLAILAAVWALLVGLSSAR